MTNDEAIDRMAGSLHLIHARSAANRRYDKAAVAMEEAYASGDNDRIRAARSEKNNARSAAERLMRS